jgi:SsrA-binding protein
MKAKKLTLIPLSLYTSGRFIKARIGLARARKQIEKRQILRQKDIEREIERDLKDAKN